MNKRKQQASSSNHNAERNRQPDEVKNDAPGYGDKKLEGPNRPST